MGSKRAINLLRRGLKNPLKVTSQVKDFTYITTAAGNHDLTAMGRGDHTILINAAKADGTYIALPEATTSNGGMHIKVVFGIAIADDFAVGFTTTNIIGGATAVGDTNEGAGSSLDYATAIADVGDTFKSVRFNLDTVGAAGGTGGTVLDFFYPGAANVVLYRGSLISEIDDPTLAGHFVTTVVTS